MKDTQSSTTLHVAAARNWHKKAADLLSQGANVNARNNEGETPLYTAAKNAYRIVEVLLEYGANVQRAIHRAAENDSLDVVNVLLALRPADIDVTDMNGFTPLQTAAENGSLDVVKALLALGADIKATNGFGWTPLHAACCFTGYRFIHQVTRHDPSTTVTTVEILLAHGADIHATDKFGWTPLHIAAWYNCSAVIEMLLAHGANIHVADNNGLTPLHVAAAANGGGVATVETLLAHGADIHVADNNGLTPLHTAALKHQTYVRDNILVRSHLYYWNFDEPERDVVKALLTHGADIHVADNDGLTPLDIALKENRLSIVKLLCQHAGITWDTRYLDRPITGLELTARVSNILEKYGISTYRHLVTKTEEELLTYDKFGRVALNEIKTQLAEAELTLGMTFD